MKTTFLLFIFSLLVSLSLSAQSDNLRGTMKVRKAVGVELKDQEFNFVWKGCLEFDTSREEIRQCTWEAMMKFVNKEIKYPEIEDPVSGTVTVKFRVARDGRVIDASVSEGLLTPLDLEALRVVKKMVFAPSSRGEADFYSFPIMFTWN